MKRNSVKGYVVLGIVFVVLSVIAFAIPTDKTATFWIAYVFTIVSFAINAFLWRLTFGKEASMKSKFLGLPVFHVGTVYLIVQIIAFFIFMFASMLPTWSAVVVCVVILGISAVCMISGEAGGDEIERVEEKVQKKVFYIQELQADIELMADHETDGTTKAALKKLAEKIRFSDPMSSEQLAGIEEKISEKAAELNSTPDKADIIAELEQLIDERNRKCKILKH